MVQPAPLIRKEPRANFVQRFVKESSSSGDDVVAAAAAVVVVVVERSSGAYDNAVDQRQGWSSSIVPIGLSSRARRPYGWSEVGR